MKKVKMLGIFLLLVFLMIGQVEADACSGGRKNFTNQNLGLAKGLIHIENLETFNVEDDIPNDVFSELYCSELEVMFGDVVLVMNYILPHPNVSRVDITDVLLPGLTVVDLDEIRQGDGPAVWYSTDSPEAPPMNWTVINDPIQNDIITLNGRTDTYPRFSIAYLARVTGPPSNYEPELTVQTYPQQDTVSVAPTITILEPEIELSNLPARENRVYKHGAVWSFGLTVTNAIQVDFSEDGANAYYANGIVTVTVDCDPEENCQEGNKILKITAGDKFQDIVFTVDNTPPTLAAPSPNSNLGRIKGAGSGGELNTLIPSISGEVSDEHAAGGQAEFQLCLDTPENCFNNGSCESGHVANKWLTYNAPVNANQAFSLTNLPSQNGRTYTWELVIRDKAGNWSDTCAHAGSYSIQIPEEPYYFKNYSTNPAPPILAQADLTLKFNFTSAPAGCSDDISGVEVFWADETNKPDSFFTERWFRDKPAKAECEDWLAALNPEGESCQWNKAWGDEPKDITWCREGWYDYWQEKEDDLASKKIGQISGAGTGLLFNKVSLEDDVTIGTYYPLMLIKGMGGAANYLLRAPEFEVRDPTDLTLELESIILNAYLTGNAELKTYAPPTADEFCLNESVNVVKTAQKRVAPLLQGQITDLKNLDEKKLEIEIFTESEMDKEEADRVPHASLRQIPIANDGSFVHAYRLGEASGPFEVSDEITTDLTSNCYQGEGDEKYTVYFMQFRLATGLGDTSDWGDWYAFRFEHQEVAEEGSSLAAGILPTRELLADGEESYAATLYLTDKYGNVISHFDDVTPRIEHGKYDLYLDTSLEYSDSATDSALQLGNSFTKENYFYTTSLSSLSPSLFSDRKLRIGEGGSAYELDNLAYGLEIPRDLALEAIITPGTEILHDAQKITPNLMNKDSDCDGYSDGLENTYWTDSSDPQDFPGFLDEDCNNPGCVVGGDDSCRIDNTPARLYYDEDGNLVFSAIRNEYGEIARELAPAAFFRSPIQVQLEYLLEQADGTYTPATFKEETWRTHTEENNTYDLKLPKFEVFTGDELRFRIVLKNLSKTANYNLNEGIDELLQQVFRFVQENAQMAEIEVLEVTQGESDPINPSFSRIDPSSYSFSADETGAFSFKFLNDVSLEKADEAGENEIRIDFSAWPGIKNRNLFSTRILSSGKLFFKNTFETISSVLLSPQIIELYRPDTYPGSMPSIAEDERELEIRRIKEEILTRVVAATRPWPPQASSSNFYEKLRNQPLHLGMLDSATNQIELLNEHGQLQDSDAKPLPREEIPLVASYGQGTVYAFRDMNIIIGDGEHPVALPETELNLVTVGGNIIVASDLLPLLDNSKALGLAALRERVDSSQNPAYHSDPIPETTENEALPGGNLLVDGQVTGILAHIFLEGALFPIDFSSTEEYKNKYLSSVWDFLTTSPLKSTYHYDNREQNRIHQLYFHGLFFSSFNTYGGLKDERPYQVLTENYNTYNLKLDLQKLRSYVWKEDSGFNCSSLLLLLVGDVGDSPQCEDVDTRSFIINTATDYGLPKIFEAGANVRMGEV